MELQKTAICKYCGEEIVWVESSIEHFWTHKGRRIGFCDPTANWLTAKTWAWPEGVEEPAPVNLTLNILEPKEVVDGTQTASRDSPPGAP